MKRCLWLVCLVMLLTLGSALAYDYTPDADGSFLEPFAQQKTNTQPGFSCQTERASYFFSPLIEEQDRDRFIDTLEKMMALLNESGFTCYVLPDYSPWVRSETREIFLSPGDETGLSQAIALLQAVHGEYTNYGLIFGTADALCKAAELPGHSLRYNEKGMLRFYNDEYLLSNFMLAYPSFTKEFNDESTLPFIKDMAVHFCNFLAEEGKLTTLLQEKDAASFNASYIALMNAFLINANAETQLYTELPPIQFGTGGANCPLMIASAHGEWYILQDFIDPISYWAEWDFDSLFDTIWQLEDDLSLVDAALGQPVQKRQFLFGSPDGESTASLYTHYQGEGPIVLPSIVSMVHEYTHACTQGLYDGESAWFLSELAAAYFEIQGAENPQDELIYTLRYDLPQDQEEYWAPVLKAMEKGNALSPLPTAEQVYHYLCYAHSQYDLYTPVSRTLNAIRSFAYFLEAHYGNEAMGRVFMEGSPLPSLGKDWPALQQEWQDYLQAMYGQGSIL